MNSQTKTIIDLILSNNNILLMMHNSPDGDAIGSAMALENTLQQLNKEVFTIFQNKISKNYSNIINKNRVNKILLPKKKYDLLIILDCSDIDRIYEKALKMSNKVIVIDHHINNKIIYDFDCIYKENVSATGIIIFNIIQEIEKQLNKTLINSFVATCLYLTIRSDTSNFKNSSTDYLSFEIASKLLKLNADIDTINEVFENREYSLLKLMSSCFHRICVDYEYKILYLIVKREDIEKSNSNYEEACLLIDYIRNINNIDTYILFIEDKDNIKVRARSNHIDVNKLMNIFNGGGHVGAAGTIIYSNNIYNVSNKVINEYKKMVNNS